VAEVRREEWRSEIELTGTLTALRRSSLSPEVDGRVVELLVDEGSEVETGALLLRLDARLAEIDRDAAAAGLAEAEARHRDAIRVRDELLRLQQGRHASETYIDSAIAQVEIAAAALAAARAELARADELLARHRLVAPFAGVIVAKLTEQGEWLARDQAAVELIAMDRLRVRATLPQRDYARIAAAAPATLRFDALPGQVFDGEVVAKVAAGDARSRIFPVLIDLPNPQRQLAPGMSARVRIETNSGSEPVLTVPRDAVVAEVGGKRRVWRVVRADDETTAEPVVVQLGRANGDRVELLASALKPGDEVVLLGNEQLKPGEPVSVQ
jgi:RND family efflux transporter MFP subunit